MKQEIKATEGAAADIGYPCESKDKTGSFYSALAQTGAGGEVVKICDGTSCRLSGADALEQIELRYGHQCQRVDCLGFCDRSPTSVMTCEELSERERTSIRCFAPQAIVTARILERPIREIREAMKAGVYQGLEVALAATSADLIEQVEASGEMGCDDGEVSIGRMWRSAADRESDKRYVIANGDEGDPGSFVDRVLLEDDPHSIIEGMLICGYAIGAGEGIVYIRSEYPQALRIMSEAIEAAREEGFLGRDIHGSGFDFDIRVFEGGGSYVCGDETALIKSIEGGSDEIKTRLHNPDRHLLYGKPTVINSIEMLVSIPFIAKQGGAAGAFFGTHATCGTKLLCLNHGFALPGLVEVEFGITFREVIEEIGGGGRDGEPLAAVLLGGSKGTLLKPEDWDLPVCLDVLRCHNIRLGHGGMVAIPESADFRGLLAHLLDYLVRESCGKCVPYRLVSQSLLNAVRKERDVSALERILETIESGSLSAAGQIVPGPIRTLIRDFGGRAFGE